MFEQLQKEMRKIYMQLTPSEKSKYVQVPGSSLKSQASKTAAAGSITDVWSKIQTRCFLKKVSEALSKLTDEQRKNKTTM